MFTYSGQSIGSHEGAPTPHDVAVALGRIPRLCAAAQAWWSYLHHAAAMLEIALWENLHYKLDDIEVARQALIRDAHSAIVLLWEDGGPWTDQIRQRIYQAWDVPFPSEDSEMAELISRAAARVFRAEVRAFAPLPMQRLPVFYDSGDVTAHSDVTIIDRVWDARSHPDSTACPRSEAVEAYTTFFTKSDLVQFRHQFGYLEGAYDERRHGKYFKRLEGAAELGGDRLPEDSGVDDQRGAD